MCVSCGCRQYDDDHGDRRNITIRDLRDAAEAGGIGVNDVGKNIDEAVTATVGVRGPGEPGLREDAPRTGSSSR